MAGRAGILTPQKMANDNTLIPTTNGCRLPDPSGAIGVQYAPWYVGHQSGVAARDVAAGLKSVAASVGGPVSVAVQAADVL